MKTFSPYAIFAVVLFCASSVAAQDKNILGDAARPQSERDIDQVRKPEEMLKFFGVKPGDKVADLMASRGYYTAILSQAVGEKGVVYSANPTVRDETRERFKAPRYANVKIVEGPMASVGLPQDGSLDFVLLNLDYHEIEKSDRAAMNKRVFAALKPGGAYGVVDHAAAEGAGDSAAKTLHRIEKSLVVNEAAAAGFKLAKESDLLKIADDPHTTNAIKEQRGKSDRFVLKFEKPK
ncbi:MAG TPA: methyltransferase domain-containing protein [Verrucomicrobiae bacterium]|jgi:predicted methyltransferase|nr:methyltransferase domain-containing protein [Verrucomicrobiae bacterium]